MKRSPTRSRAPQRAILVRRQPVSVKEMSRGGCRIASAQPLAVGAVGVLAVDIEGEVHAEVFRVARCAARPDGRDQYEAGVEFLPMPADSASLHDLAAQLDQAHHR